MEHKEIFAEIRKERGGVAEIYSEFSQYPQGVKAHYEFYKAIVLDDGPLSRNEREWLAMETSIANECPYCYRHHNEAFVKIGGTKKVAGRRMELLSVLAATLSKSYWKAKVLRDQFTEEGFSEAEWQHAVMVVSYFNFANRCAHALDLKLEEDFEVTCN